MTFSEKLALLRKKQGLSQEQLAGRLGVTRQSVSKWESALAFPEIDKLVALSNLFGVSVDYLVKDELTEPAGPSHLEERLDELYRRTDMRYFAYTSRAKLFGLPLLSVRFGRDRSPTRDNTAVGVVAVGNFAVGGVAVGLISLGAVSVGMVTFGLLALGAVAIGGFAAGISTIGVCAWGVASIGAAQAGGVAALSLKSPWAVRLTRLFHR